MVNLADHMTEAQWQQRITNYADLRNVRWWHDTDSRRNKSGLPDLLLVGPGGVAWLELKRQNGRVSTEQRRWIEALGQHMTALVARPADWDDVRALVDRLAGVGT